MCAIRFRHIFSYSILHSVFIASANAEIINAKVIAARGVTTDNDNLTVSICQFDVMRRSKSVDNYPKIFSDWETEESACFQEETVNVGRYTVHLYASAFHFDACATRITFKVGDAVVLSKSDTNPVKLSDAAILAGDPIDEFSTCHTSTELTLNTRRYACTLFEHANYGGEMFPIAANSTVNNLGHMNDKTTSVLVSNACTLTLYKHENTIERLDSYSSDNANIASNHHDEATSATCECSF